VSFAWGRKRNKTIFCLNVKHTHTGAEKGAKELLNNKWLNMKVEATLRKVLTG
jgi:hypothetical protein